MSHNTTRYTITVDVDMDTLVDSYISNNGIDEDEEIPSFKDLILWSMNCVNQDGLDTIEITEIED